MHNGRNYLVEQHIFRALSTFSSVVDTRPNKIMVGPMSVQFVNTSGPRTEEAPVGLEREVVQKTAAVGHTPEFAPVTMINLLAVLTASTTPHS